MGDKKVITLREFKNKLFSRTDDGGLLEKKRVTEQCFIERLFPCAFLSEPLSRLFADYPGHNNPTRNKIFGGTYCGEVLQTRISELFVNDPEIWTEFEDRCSHEIVLSACDRTRLTAFLLETAKQMPSANVDPKLCVHGRGLP